MTGGGSCYLFRHWTEVLSCLISSSAFLSAMSLCLCWSSSLSCNVIRSVLKASDKEENLFSMSWSDKFSALKIFSNFYFHGLVALCYKINMRIWGLFFTGKVSAVKEN